MDLTQLLSFTLENNASDLHLSTGSPPIMRINGQLKRLQGDPLTNDDVRSLLYGQMSEDQRAIYERDQDIDFAITINNARFRVNGYNTRLGASAVFRVIPSQIPTMEELDLPAVMRRFASLEKGIVLVTGPTGSGKSTTLAAMIDYINQNTSKHILTIEDPVEFFHTSKKSLISHREIGEDTHDFKSALKGALREDPDVILVGEMRDYETISLALTAAETGHLVFGTLHSNSAAKTIDRIIEVFPSNDKPMVRSMLASSLQGVVFQGLLKRADGSGRVGAYEILVGTNAVRNLIRENNLAQIYSMMQTGSRFGMVTMDDAIKALQEGGIVTQEEAERVLIKVADDSAMNTEQNEGDYVSGALGGKKAAQTGIDTVQSDVMPSAKGKSDKSDEGYSF